MVNTYDTSSDTAWYANLADGLHLIASSGHAGEGLFLSGYVPRVFNLYSPGYFVLKFPADSGDTWKSTPTLASASDDRQWGGYKAVSNAAGSFNCIKLNTGSQIEYYAAKGLVRMYPVAMYKTTKITGYPGINLVYVNFYNWGLLGDLI